MEENEVDAEPFVVDAKPALAANEGKIVAQLQQEIGEMPDERLLQIRLGVFVLEVEEFEDERVFDGFFGRHRVAGFGSLRLLQHGGFVLRKRDAFVELAADLAVQLADGPARAESLGLVESPGLWVLDGEQPDVGGPGQGETGARSRNERSSSVYTR